MDASEKVTSRRETCWRCKGRGFIEYVGSQLRAKRQAHGISMRSVARRLKLSAAYLCDVENNRRSATERIRKFYDNL